MELYIADLENLTSSARAYPLCTVESAMTLVRNVLCNNENIRDAWGSGNYIP